MEPFGSMISAMDESDYIATASAVIALAAIGVAIWQGYVSRKHNILSVKPRFHIDKSYIEGLHYSLESQGLGPGVVKSFAIFLGEKEISNPKKDPWPEIFRSLGVTGINYDFHIPSVGSTHAPGTSRQLLSVTLTTSSTSPSALNVIDRAVNFRIVYTSLYENEAFLCDGDMA